MLDPNSGPEKDENKDGHGFADIPEDYLLTAQLGVTPNEKNKIDLVPEPNFYLPHSLWELTAIGRLLCITMTHQHAGCRKWMVNALPHENTYKESTGPRNEYDPFSVAQYLVCTSQIPTSTFSLCPLDPQEPPQDFLRKNSHTNKYPRKNPC